MTSDAVRPPEGLWSPDRRALSLGLVLTITLVAFESLAVSTVMPIVRAELGDLALYGWVFSAFFLGSLIGIVVVGGLIDRGGLVRPFVVGLGLFAIGLVIDGLAPSMPVLVAGRFLQGLGGGAIPPTAYVAIGRSMPESLRPRMFATLSTAWVLPGVIGPAIAGLVGEHLHWRLVFLGLLPLIALSGGLTLSALRAVPGSGAAATTEHEAASASARRLPQALLVALGAGLTLGGLTSGVVVPAIVLVALGLVVGLPAIRRLTPPGTLVAARGLPATVLLRGLLTFGFFAADAYVTLALQSWRRLDASVAGLALTGATVAWTSGAWIQARWINRLGARRLVRLGFALVAVGVLGFGLVLPPTLPVAIGIGLWAVAGLGMGLAYSPLSLTVLREARPGEEGSATSALQLSDVLGTALGTGAGGAIIAAADTGGLEEWVGLAGAFAVGAGVLLVGLVLTRQMHGRRAWSERATTSESVAA
jgi:MFS family permease